MLTELWVSNLAVMKEIRAQFRPGLNALTGETGAGKSLVVESLDLVLGARASADLVRKGAKEAEVIARFELPPRHFVDQGIDQPLDEGSLVLRRVIGAEGRSRSYVNDRPATVGRLRELGTALADLHGQHEQQNLLREETHLDYLDAHAGCFELREKVSTDYETLRASEQALEEFREATRKSTEEREFHRFQLEELDAAALVEGEEENLERDRHLAAHSGRLLESAGGAFRALSADDANAVGLLAEAARFLSQGAGLDPDLEPLRRQLDEATVAAEEIARELARYVDGLNADPTRLEEIEARLDTLSRLRRKYNADVAELIRRRETLRVELEAWEEAPRRLKELESEHQAARSAVHESCAELSAARSRGAAEFARRVTHELKGLGMEGGRFWVEFRPPRQGTNLPERQHPVNARGAEEAAFVLAANPGEGGGPLGRIASGGEGSRVMLALKNVLRRVDPIPLAIFDEVDAGIGGLVASAVGSRLASIAGKRQVLVVTHLAVIAGKADHHLRITKTTAGGRTRIDLEEVSGSEREAELARMLAGSVGGEDARRTARTLLSEGKRR
jgi:DNA repair protein RecN (Recombination protein N)